MKLHDVMRLARLFQRVSQSEVGSAMGIAQTQMSRYESGRSSPTVEKWLLWCKALGLDPHDVLKMMEE